MIIIKKQTYFKKRAVFLTFILLLGIILSALSYFKFKPLVYTAAQKRAEIILLNATNEAVLNVLQQNNISYENIAKLSRDSDGRVTSLEIDTVKINFLKSKIAFEIPDILSKREYYDVKIPIGTFLGSEYTNGIGPRIKFNMQLAPAVLVDFEHEFIDAGINQVLHRIVIRIRINCSIIMIGASENFSVSTAAIAAQTVIVGSAPDAFTEVIETPDDKTAGIINDYGAGN